jgi:hypothetical protein
VGGTRSPDAAPRHAGRDPTIPMSDPDESPRPDPAHAPRTRVCPSAAAPRRIHHRVLARKRTVPSHAPTTAPALANGRCPRTRPPTRPRWRSPLTRFAYMHPPPRLRPRSRCAHAPHSLASPAIVLRSPALATDGALACTHHHPVPAVSYSPSAPRPNPIRATTPFQFLNFSVSDLT